ncbi:MAG TPA: hypothetical protein VGC03_03830 [Acidimicrobiia bacterium]
MAIVAAIDLIRTALEGRSRSRVPIWRRWLYVFLLIVVAFPAARIALGQAAGGYSDSHPMLIFVVGTWVLTPLILVEFLVWLLRRFEGLTRLTPVAAIITIGIVTYLATSNPDIACIRHSADNVFLFRGDAGLHRSLRSALRDGGLLFAPGGDREQAIRADDETESIHA